ncbi:MAG: hypothetical protein ACODAC_06805 [Pseudomonadota bacterium]
MERTLRFSRALLELAVRGNGAAMGTISRVHTAVAAVVSDIAAQCDSLTDERCSAHTVARLKARCAAASSLLRDGAEAVQAHDITDQRLAHLARLLEVMRSGADIDIDAFLTEAEERTLLMLIEQGVTVDEALARLEQAAPDTDRVELF